MHLLSIIISIHALLDMDDVTDFAWCECEAAPSGAKSNGQICVFLHVSAAVGAGFFQPFSWPYIVDKHTYLCSI